MNLQHNPVDWSQVIFTAEATREPFEDITVITARHEFVNVANMAACDIIIQQGQQPDAQAISQVAQALINSAKLHVQEFVEVSETGLIRVCVDVESIDDETVMWRALDLVSKGLDQLDGDIGTVYFGEPKRFTVAQVPSILSH